MRTRFALALLFVLAGSATAQETCFRLKAFSDLGVPVHPESGNPSVSARLADGAIAQKLETDPANDWVKIKADETEGWIIQKYVDVEVTCPSVTMEFGSEADQEGLYRVGCWNLEHFHEGATRGFPENTNGGPTYPTRTQSDYEAIAAIIEQLDLKIIAMSEIFAEDVEVVEDNESFVDTRSSELDRLIGVLGEDNYSYVVGSSGGAQHLAILYDMRFAKLNASWEMELPEIKIQGKSIADRQPLVAHFTFLDDGEQNDFAVVGVHLASGQQNNENHDEAMRLLVQNLADARAEGWCLPKNESDVLVMGDFNANRFDGSAEAFWDAMEGDGWDVLGDNENGYSPTRLSGNPLELRNSRIDYIIATSGERGLQGEEVSQDAATVHTELLAAGADIFRSQCSDHLPVSVQVRVMGDSDIAEGARSFRLARNAPGKN